ncbi:ribosome small subunit-dependent GTPase A [Bacteroidetes bacterium endosymbiont of Geopemphigus sp.]|uniref:ribosome small subunit-dependent GTPase A n=1 Tax=Bacteroidetes bacterium endosymbiont of Geopemphigus sp. TaxID=2047937 RepID=UPI000CD04856|nr:ribosome small subunit-dependent GTPase A [Bacteroidetes bacterium endosymbiont of Geopemphigus sp.]
MKGTVIRSTGSWYEVRTNEGILQARIKGQLRLENSKSTNPVAVGDYVEVQKKSDDSILIVKICERKNYLLRRAVNLSKRTHILAANIDQCFLIVTLENPHTSREFIDRLLVCTEAYRIPTILLFNKIDLHDKIQIDNRKAMKTLYKSIGYECMEISVKTGRQLEKVKETMFGKTSILTGHSGTGKSSLINALVPKWHLRTNTLSGYHLKGRHTTTFSQMHQWPFGGYIIDTPGIKGFGVVDMKKDKIQDYFPEIFHLRSECRFNNCLHTDEPNCRIKKAVEEKKIAYSRYQSYCGLLKIDKSRYRMEDWA